MSKASRPAAPNDPEAQVFKRPPQYYNVWQRGEGIPVHETFHVESLQDVGVGPWKRFGANGCFINLTDSFLVGAFVLEIPPGKTLNPMHHLFEGTTYVVAGAGETVIEQKGSPTRKVTWAERSLFAPPLNTTYQHRNTDSDRPARLLVVNNAPLVLSLYHDDDFVFGSDYMFRCRYEGEDNYFDGIPEYLGSRLSRVNYIRDVGTYELYNWEMRGKGAKTAFMSLSSGTLAAHISSFEVGTYKKAHRHGAGAHVVMLDGEGYSLLWKEGDRPTRVNWRAGTMFAPPEWWYHQHFNTGKEPARYLAIRNNNPEHPLRLGMPRIRDSGEGMTQFGKAQIDFSEEDPAIFAEYAAELTAKGVELRQARPVYRSA
ncbi:MAG: ethanolamine ammonia lyase-activating protein [Alphaproteobacteria bacterium]|nr:ethanolamine ammonia lyase-activating protein [Alphaproteobacteria bacterium]